MTSFRNMSDKEWDQIQDVHLKGAFSCTHAAWPIFRKQKFGRIVNTASAAGLFGESLVFKLSSVNVSYSRHPKGISDRLTTAQLKWVWLASPRHSHGRVSSITSRLMLLHPLSCPFTDT